MKEHQNQRSLMSWISAGDDWICVNRTVAEKEGRGAYHCIDFRLWEVAVIDEHGNAALFRESLAKERAPRLVPDDPRATGDKNDDWSSFRGRRNAQWGRYDVQAIAREEAIDDVASYS